MRLIICPNCGWQICVGCSKNHAVEDGRYLALDSVGPDNPVLRGMVFGSLDNERILVLAGGDPGSPAPFRPDPFLVH